MAADGEKLSASVSTTATSEEDVQNPPPIDKEECLKTALNFLVQGKRDLLVKDIPHAISALGEACQLLTEVSGPLGTESAEAHFYYGKALLEQSRLDLAVFDGPAAAKVDSGEEDESEEEESDEADNDATNTGDGDEAEAKSITTADSEDTKISSNGSEKPMDEDLSSPSPSENRKKDEDADEKPSTSQGIQEQEVDGEPEEELSNLELAWEVLEVAKIGYKRQLDGIKSKLEEADSKTNLEKEKLIKCRKDWQKRLADTHSLLGEVATESESYPQAVEEFQTGLSLLVEIEEPDSREIAQYYFQMGLAYAFDKKFADAIVSFEKSTEIIGQRIGNLSSRIENKKPTLQEGVEDQLYSEEKEIEELKALMPELQEKISDTIDAENESKKAIEEEKEEKEIMLRNSPIKNANPPIANDISHLVKKKKADDLPGIERPSKRVCPTRCNPPVTNDISHLVKKKTEVTSGADIPIKKLFTTPTEPDDVTSSTSTNGHNLEINDDV